MRTMDFTEASFAFLVGILMLIVVLASIKRNPPKKSDAEPKAVYSEPKAVYSEPKTEYSEKKQKLTSSKKRKNRHGIQSAAKKRSFKN